MTKEQIKEATTMYEVLGRYGLKSGRGSMVSCPFHGEDKHPSMKVYKDGFYCFACGLHGDVFDFVQNMEHCDFKTAFKILGGEYDQERKTSTKIAIWRKKNAQQKKAEQAERIRRKKQLNNELISAYRWIIAHTEPMSDAWADAVHALQLQLYIHEGLNE